MRTRWRFVLALALLATQTVAHAQSVQAQAQATSVSVKADVVTITVNIDVPGVSKKDAKAWKADAESVWKEAFGRLPYKCFKLQLVVNVTPQSEDFEARPDHHLIFKTDGVNGMVLKPRGDTTFPYENATDGAWGDLPAAGFAHEVGHLMGLGDDYTEVSKNPRVTKPLPGRQHTLMADGGPVDKALVDRLGAVLRKAGKLPSSCWTGAIRVRVVETFPEGTVCNLAGDGRVTLIVAGSGEVSGTIDVDSTYTCNFGFSDQDSASMDVAGQRTDEGFTLQLSSSCKCYGVLIFPPDRLLEVPITGPGRAEGTLTFRLSVADYTYTSSLECSACEEAVG